MIFYCIDVLLLTLDNPAKFLENTKKFQHEMLLVHACSHYVAHW